MGCARFSTLLGAVCLIGSQARALTPQDEKAITQAARSTLPELVEAVKIPNVMRASTADMRANADWVEAAFKRHGFTARQLADGETPMVYAAGPAAAKGARTVLFYAHMDGQAVNPAEWDQPGPFVPTLKRKRADGSWETLPIETLSKGALDPEWRLFARSAADDKAPILMLMAAMDALKATGRKPAIRIKILIDSHEEGGPPTLKDVVDRNAELLKADAVVMLDGPMHESNKPTLVFGHRGGGGFALTVWGARSELHSGHYGNYAANPAFGLAQLIATMKDADGRVLIPGFYDGVALDPASKAARAAVPDDEVALRKRLGIRTSEKVGESYQEALAYPSLNITSMKAGSPEASRTIIPAFAIATFDARTVPGTPAPRQIALVRKWVEDQGYHLVKGPPTDEERATWPKLATITGGDGQGQALQTPLDAPVGGWARAALVDAWKAEPVRIPIMGGSVPTRPLVDGVKAPILLVPLVNNDNNQHAANENLRIGNYFMGVKSLYALFTRPL
ncbi:M20/M25/M40 family metallo-hydrolase [Sphingomonas sp.]|uniref:M20/M25/M40 family metallo-hydrolase n=1 Tax=Sphingomonas sp. TaxID=28214 RepID=UPI000DAFD393|nr:M20/M25/M40 family metallo-hydrolase [Sphingomonas sp.]PZU08731.1 MAG: acetylornithine deacetylase [Sphingomonas sp.]